MKLPTISVCLYVFVFSYLSIADTWIHTITGNKLGGPHPMTLLNFHCHAPTCLDMSVYMCAEGIGLDACNTTNGELLCQQSPVHGGAGCYEILQFIIAFFFCLILFYMFSKPYYYYFLFLFAPLY